MNAKDFCPAIPWGMIVHYGVWGGTEEGLFGIPSHHPLLDDAVLPVGVGARFRTADKPVWLLIRKFTFWRTGSTGSGCSWGLGFFLLETPE